MTPDHEIELLSRAAKGDEDAYAAVVMRHAPAFVRYLQTIMRDAEGAEDVAQEAFVRAYRKLGRLRSPDRFRQWLWKIGRCAALDVMRTLQRVGTSPAETLTQKLDLRPSDDASADLWMEHESVLRRIREAVAELPREARELIELRYARQCSYREIAERLGINHAQVKARLARARARLKSKLDGIAQEWNGILDEMP